MGDRDAGYPSVNGADRAALIDWKPATISFQIGRYSSIKMRSASRSIQGRGQPIGSGSEGPDSRRPRLTSRALKTLAQRAGRRLRCTAWPTRLAHPRPYAIAGGRSSKPDQLVRRQFDGGPPWHSAQAGSRYRTASVPTSRTDLRCDRGSKNSVAWRMVRRRHLVETIGPFRTFTIRSQTMTRFVRHPHEIAVRPSRPVIVHHVGDLRQQQPARLQHPRCVRNGG